MTTPNTSSIDALAIAAETRAELQSAGVSASSSQQQQQQHKRSPSAASGASSTSSFGAAATAAADRGSFASVDHVGVGAAASKNGGISSVADTARMMYPDADALIAAGRMSLDRETAVNPMHMQMNPMMMPPHFNRVAMSGDSFMNGAGGLNTMMVHHPTTMNNDEQRRRSMTNDSNSPFTNNTKLTPPHVPTAKPNRSPSDDILLQTLPLVNNYSCSSSSSSKRKPNFAEKLHSVLSNPQTQPSISWLPSGHAFCILNQQSFIKHILPQFFREAKFESFARRLKRWGFKKVYTTTNAQVIYSHSLFHRERPDLCEMMNGREGKGNDDVGARGEESEHSSATGSGGGGGGAIANVVGTGGIMGGTMGNMTNKEKSMQAEQLQYYAMVANHQMQQEAAARALAMKHHQMEMQMQVVQEGTRGVGGMGLGGGYPRNHMLGMHHPRIHPIMMGRQPFPPRGNNFFTFEDTSDTSNDNATLNTHNTSFNHYNSNLHNHHNWSNHSTSNNDINPSQQQQQQQPSLAKRQLDRLNDDIKSCEEQLQLLQKLKKLKEMRREIAEAAAEEDVEEVGGGGVDVIEGGGKGRGGGSVSPLSQN